MRQQPAVEIRPQVRTAVPARAAAPVSAPSADDALLDASRAIDRAALWNTRRIRSFVLLQPQRRTPR